MKKVFLVLLAVQFVVACGPRDVPMSRSNNSFNNKGGAQGDKKKSFVVSKEGERSDTCPENKQDYRTLVVPEMDIDSMNNGRVKAGLEAGNMNCFRVGSKVGIKTSFDSKEIIANVVVKKTEGVAVNRLNQKHAEAFDMELDDLIARGEQEIENAKNRPKGKFDPQGMVSITYFEIPSENEQKNQDDDLENGAKSFFFKQGERPTNCAKEQKDLETLVIPMKVFVQSAAMSMKAAIVRKDKNCFRIGSKVKIKYVENDLAPSLREVQIGAVEIIRSADLSSAHTQMLGLDLPEIKIHYEAELKDDFISIVYFQ